jgi:hypothetical protein
MVVQYQCKYLPSVSDMSVAVTANVSLFMNRGTFYDFVALYIAFICKTYVPKLTVG